MTALPKVAMWVQGASLALMLALCAGSARGQGTVVFVVPQQPISYDPVNSRTYDIDLDGDGTTDYSLLVGFGEADLLAQCRSRPRLPSSLFLAVHFGRCEDD